MCPRRGVRARRRRTTSSASFFDLDFRCAVTFACCAARSCDLWLDGSLCDLRLLVGAVVLGWRRSGIHGAACRCARLPRARRAARLLEVRATGRRRAPRGLRRTAVVLRLFSPTRRPSIPLPFSSMPQPHLGAAVERAVELVPAAWSVAVDRRSPLPARRCCLRLTLRGPARGDGRGLRPQPLIVAHLRAGRADAASVARLLIRRDRRPSDECGRRCRDPVPDIPLRCASSPVERRTADRARAASRTGSTSRRRLDRERGTRAA